MNLKRLNALEEDWLASNAVIAFVGALLAAQSWKLSEGGTELPLIATKLTIPALPDIIYLAVGAFLFVLSFVLAVASVVPPRLRCHALRITRPFLGGLPLLVWLAFTIGWLEAVAELASDQWWFLILFYGGYAFFFFLGYRFLRGTHSSPPPTEDSSHGAGSE